TKGIPRHHQTPKRGEMRMPRNDATCCPVSRLHLQASPAVQLPGQDSNLDKENQNRLVQILPSSDRPTTRLYYRHLGRRFQPCLVLFQVSLTLFWTKITVQ